MTKEKEAYHVVSGKKGGWVIKKGERSRPTHQFETKHEAVDYARKISKRERSELVVHRKDGSIQQVDRYSSSSSRSIPQYHSTDKTDLDQIKTAVRAVYVIPKEGSWIVTKGGSEISSSKGNISDALHFAWNVRRERGTEVIVVDDEGKVIRSSDYSDYDEFVEDSNKITR
jgi:hypothetical protein